MSVLIRVGFVGLAAACLVAQTVSGEIGGRLTDKQHSALPGVRVRIANGDQSKEAVTDGDGRFSLPSLTMGTYRVVAELAGFKTASGTIAISAATPIAFLTWSLEVGCLSEIQRVILGPKSAARLVEEIVHVRAASPAQSVLISTAPDCEGRVFRRYSVQVLDSVPGRVRTRLGQRQVFMEPRSAGLMLGQEYLVLLWSDGSTSDDLVLPIISGRVVSKESSELNRLNVREALSLLAKWSEERQR
jgi:hypothetical protein